MDLRFRVTLTNLVLSLVGVMVVPALLGMRVWGWRSSVGLRIQVRSRRGVKTFSNNRTRLFRGLPSAGLFWICCTPPSPTRQRSLQNMVFGILPYASPAVAGTSTSIVIWSCQGGSAFRLCVLRPIRLGWPVTR